MPGGFRNQARMTILSSGTGSFTLGIAVSPYETFANAGVTDQEIVPYSAVDGTANSEKGWGVYTSSSATLTRNVFISTNSNNPINASSSATQVFIDPSAADLVHLTTMAHANAGGL